MYNVRLSFLRFSLRSWKCFKYWVDSYKANMTFQKVLKDKRYRILNVLFKLYSCLVFTHHDILIMYLCWALQYSTDAQSKTLACGNTFLMIITVLESPFVIPCLYFQCYTYSTVNVVACFIQVHWIGKIVTVSIKYDLICANCSVNLFIYILAILSSSLWCGLSWLWLSLYILLLRQLLSSEC